LLRATIFRRDEGRCQRCFASIRGRDWAIVHIRPHENDATLFWSETNLHLVCARCAGSISRSN
jgi:5-methylcytosine-specific restriction endonuclease McrA